MNILTLTTDLGVKDHYLAALKARALSMVPDVLIVDVSNHIPAFDIAKAAFVLGNVWHHFPKGSVHIVAVDTQWSPQTPYIAAFFQGHYFIGTDNGTFSLIFGDLEPEEIVQIEMRGDEDLTFPAQSVLVPAAASLLRQGGIAGLGQQVQSYRKRPQLAPVVEEHNIRGMVIYIDSYGNVITNITREVFDRVVGNRPFYIATRRGDSDLRRISRTYNEVSEGERVALFTSAGYLEIAINRGVEGSGGGATDLLGLRVNDTVRIEIED